MPRKVQLECNSFDEYRKEAEKLKASEANSKNTKQRKRNTNNTARKKTKRPTVKQNKLFYDIVWKTCMKLGWRLEVGNRPKDYYYLPPGVCRKDPQRQFKNRVDFFDSIKQVLNFLPNESYWKNKKEIVDCLALLRDSINYIMENKKVLPKDFTTEWIIERIKEKRKKESGEK